MNPTSIELFSGVGGLALGMSRAGFKHALLVEYDGDMATTIRENQTGNVDHVVGWPFLHMDVRDIDWTPYRGKISVISGGPPCQPFGIGGKKRGPDDHRDMWPEAVRAVRIVNPGVFVFENVRNLAGPKFSSYRGWVKECLRRPNYPRRDDESHAEHLHRLRNMQAPASYVVDHILVNAADYGAPQVRWRVLVRGVQASSSLPLTTLDPTHSLDRLLWDQWKTGDYWKRHDLPQPSDDAIPPNHQTRVKLLRRLQIEPKAKPWVTIRDAISGLGEPNGKKNHVMQLGARVYKGHTGSHPDQPSKALKAGDHGVPGGENMMILPGGGVRYFTMREAARLVNLPDDFHFPASWTETMRGLGNAVPAALGEAIGRWLAGMTDALDSVAVPKMQAEARS